MSTPPPPACATFLPQGLGLCRVGTSPSVEAIDHAANLLLVHAKSLADSVATRAFLTGRMSPMRRTPMTSWSTQRTPCEGLVRESW